MLRLHMVIIASFAFLLGSQALQAQDLSRYREFQMGSSLAAVGTASGASAHDVKVVHQHPALIQELRWRPDQRYGNGVVPTEAVREVIFSFYNDRLYRIVVDYDRARTEGLTDAGLIDSISASYGVPVLKATNLPTVTPPALGPADGETVVASWSDPERTVTLLRGNYPTTLHLVFTLKALDVLARTASIEAMRKDKDEAPQRELDRQTQAKEAGLAADAKAREVNKPLFKP